MSGGGGDTTTTTNTEIPKEFKNLIFGTAGDPANGVGGGGFGIPAKVQAGFNQGAINSGGVAPFPTLGLLQNPTEGATPTEGQRGFSGVLAEAVDLFRQGNLAPSLEQGETTLAALDARKNLAGTLGTEFVPQIQDIFSSFGDQAGGIADIATEGLERQLQRNTLPSIAQGAIQAGQFGSSRQGIAEGLATAEANRDIADARSQILFAGADRQLGFSSQLANLLGLPSSVLSEVGAFEDESAQNTAEGEFQNLLRLSQLVQGFIPGASQTTIGPDNSPSAFQGALGGAASGAAIGSAVPGIGTAIGAGVGGLIGLLG